VKANNFLALQGVIKMSNEQKEMAELKSQIAQLLFYLQTPLSEPDRQICWLLLDEFLRQYYDLK